MTDRFCSSCAAPLAPDARFCPNCAHPVNEGTGTETETEAVAVPLAPAPGPEPAGAPPPSHRARTSVIAAVAVAAVLLLAVGATVLLTRSSGAGGEIFLESASSTGPDPFTDSTAIGGPPGSLPGTSVPTSASTTIAGGSATLGTVQGGTVGLYGGTLNNASCDREKQITYLQANPDKAAAFASVLSITTSQIPDYLRRLTPVVLLRDTRVTNHGFANGAATSRQAVLQAGTAVLVDEYGIPRVRCACGNPLTPPAPVAADVRFTGATWPGFNLNQTIVVTGTTRIDVFVLIDVQTGGLFDRPSGTDGTRDKPNDGGTTSTTTTASSTTTTTTAATTTTAGGATDTKCADTAEGAVNRLLDARRRNDRVDASVCGSPPVLDYLWGLSSDFVATLRLDRCELTTQFGPTQYNDDVDACYLSNNAFLAVPRVSRPPDPNWIVSFVVLIDGKTTTTTAAQEVACGSSGESLVPTTAAEQVLVDYFRAINAKDYAKAWSYLDGAAQSFFGSEADFTTLMAQHVNCVRVLGATVATSPGDPEVSASTGTQWYSVHLAAQYSSPFPAGSGEFPQFWKVRADPKPGAPAPKITGIATGL